MRSAIIVLILFVTSYLIFNVAIPHLNEREILNINVDRVNIIKMSPPNLQVYHSINKWAPKFEVPYEYAYRMLIEETAYNNPLDITWKHYQVSYANAYGPAQVLLKTARWINNDNSISKSDLLHNVEFNVYTSMKLINWIYTQRKDWYLTFGWYNTGQWKVNQYSRNIVL